MGRVIFYIDGFNLYYGLKSKSWKRYYWLDVERLANRLLRPGQTLAATRYFTARVVSSEPRDAGKKTRQDAYLGALATLPGVSIHYGDFARTRRHCRVCDSTWWVYEEKMTDVNIAVKILSDANADRFDTAVIVSGDGDLTGPVKEVRTLYPDKRVVIAFPPGRHSANLRNAANRNFTIGRSALRDSQFPDVIIKPDGYPLSRPVEWE